MQKRPLGVPEGAELVTGRPSGVPEDAEMISQGRPRVEPKTEEENPLERILSNRYNKAAEFVKRQYSNGNADGLFRTPQVAVGVAGQVAGAGLDVIGEAVTQVGDKVIPEPVQEFAKEKFANLLQTGVGKAGLSALQKGQEAWESFSEKYPDASIAIESGMNLTAFGVAKKGAALVEKEMIDTASDISGLLVKTKPGELDNRIMREVRVGFKKGTRPTVEGKRTFSQTEKYFQKAHSAVESIVANKKGLSLVNDAGEVIEGALPKNLSEFTQAIEQTKQALFKKYDEMASSTGGVIKVSPIAKELRELSETKAKILSGADSFLTKYADKLDEIGDLTAEEAQAILKDLNSELKAYFKNPSTSDSATATMKAFIAEKLRTAVDDVVENARGKGYVELKRRYGALKAIEHDVNKRAVVDMRRDLKGLIDFSDIFSGSQAINALVSKNPALFAAATGAKGISSYYKRLKDPNRIIKQMFENVDELYQKKQSFTPKSTIFKQAENIADKSKKLKDLKKTRP